MTDVFSKQKRSSIMSSIRSAGNKSTELRLIAIFREHGITGWRRNQRLPGKPDFVFRRGRVAVFVDGCFWHGCPKCYIRPASNQEYWDEKIARNRKRDRDITRLLKDKGWTVLRVWQHQLREPGRIAALLKRTLSSRAP